ncbi:MAG: hypothetical protein BWK80_22485 [Desulfobacteraceae bacterium IS3]|nr:MAG: hypothetical protein BWK80_22485 [Desulfobacteraceae bacterium IS3]
MITKIEIDGFKTFQDFKLDLGHFQVIIGPNGAGKSNLFDAFRLLSRLADSDLRTAFQDMRGEAGELFMTLPDGNSLNRMRLCVELFLDRQVQDSWGAKADLKHTRLRYEVEISRRTDARGIDRLYVDRESLVPILRGKDTWIRRYKLKNRLPKFIKGRTVPFISTQKENTTSIQLHQDGHGGKKAVAAEKMERTVLSGINNTEFPHAFAVCEEMRSWRFLQLNPEVLRQPGSMLARPFIKSDGTNLPAALARMQAEDKFVLNDISRDLANLIPGILKVEVREDRTRDQYLIYVHTHDGRSFSSRVLSDGTLRALALIAFKNDSQHRGVLCFEEPENGVHPFRLKNLVEVLRELSTDFSDHEQKDEPLRQLLINTHSPVLARQEPALPGLLFAYTASPVQPGQSEQPQRVTRIVPVESGQQAKLHLGITDEEEIKYTRGQVRDYLETADFGEIADSI